MATDRVLDDVCATATAVEQRLAAGAPPGDWLEAEIVVALLILVFADPSRLGGTRLRADGSSTQHLAVVLAAQALGRTEDAVVLKVMNLRSVATAGGRGMSGGSRRDRAVVARFGDALDELLAAAWLVADALPAVRGVLEELGRNALMAAVGADRDDAALVTEARREVVVRRGQGMFRVRVLANYAHTCAVCGLRAKQPERNAFLLVASHILPWAAATDHQRLDPRNGLALCAIHDRAFEWGFLTVDPQLRVVASAGARDHYAPEARVEAEILDHHGRAIHRAAARFAPPDEGYLRHHREQVFDRRFRLAG